MLLGYQRSGVEVNSNKVDNFEDSKYANHDTVKYSKEFAEIDKIAAAIKKLPQDERILAELSFLKKTLCLQTVQNFAIDADWALNYSDFLTKRTTKIPKNCNNQEAANTVHRGNSNDVGYYKINHIVWTFVKKIYGLSLDVFLEENQRYLQNNADQNASFMDLIVLKGARLSPVGINNEHFYCYLNAVTQALLGVEPFTEALVERRKIGKIGPYTDALLDIINSHKALKESDAKNLKELVLKTFNYRNQHDAHEALIHILTHLRGELRVLKQNSSSQQQYTSPILETFMGQVTNQMTCRSCKSSFQAHDPIIDISLPINSQHKTLNDCLDSYFAPEELSDPFACPRCRKGTKAYTQLVFEHMPKVLVLHLKRFREYPKREKISDEITFPVDYLNLTRKDKTASEQLKYTLKGLVVHSGSVYGGHYVAYSKRNNDWYLCNDSIIRKVSAEDVANKEAYIMLYQRIE